MSSPNPVGFLKVENVESWLVVEVHRWEHEQCTGRGEDADSRDH